MKKIFQLLGILFFASVLFVACSKDSDPADNDIFVGTYRGTTSYKDDNNSIVSGEGAVTVTKAGNNYRFIFNRNIPDFGEEFKRNDDNSFVSIGSNSFSGITINANKLTMLVTKNGKTWTANCSR